MGISNFDIHVDSEMSEEWMKIIENKMEWKNTMFLTKKYTRMGHK